MPVEDEVVLCGMSLYNIRVYSDDGTLWIDEYVNRARHAIVDCPSQTPYVLRVWQRSTPCTT